ncbi:MAG TPA: glycosyltransferase, partial [Chloroflexia bacterium]|nr:glycosyltransferase [Chloroflexia bacterium]
MIATTSPTPTQQLQVISLAGLRPDPDALLVLQPRNAYAWRILPIGWRGEKLVIVASRPIDAQQIRALSLQTRWAITQRLCSEIELQMALDKYYGRASQPRETLRSIDPLALVRALDLLPNDVLRTALGQQAYNREEQGGKVGEDDTDGWLTWLLGQGQLDVEQVTLLRAAQHNRPYLRIARFESHPGLAVLVPALLAARWNAVPFYADALRVWVYTPGDAPLANPDDLSRATGLDVCPVFVTRTQWEIAFVRLYKESRTPAVTIRSLDEVLAEEGWLSAGQKAQAREVVRRTGTSITALAREKGWLNEQDWSKVEARRWGLLPGYDPVPEDISSLSGLRFAISLGRRWGIVPLAVHEDGLHVGLMQPAQSRFGQAVEAIAQQKVHTHLLSKDQFRRAWSLFYTEERNPSASFSPFSTLSTLPSLPTLPTLPNLSTLSPVAPMAFTAPVPSFDEWLVAGAYATTGQIDKALERGRAEGTSLNESLLALGLADAADLAEITALQCSLPWFPLDHPPRQLPPEQRATLGIDRKVVALLDLGRSPDGPKSVLVAVSDPFELSTGPDIQEIDAAILQPLIVPKSALTLASELSETEHHNIEDFLRYLVQRRYLRPELMPELLRGAVSGQQPLDMLLAHEMADPERVYKALADFSSLPLVHLNPDYKQEMVVDALGRVKRRTSTKDPVTTKAQHVSLFDARRWAAMPVSEAQSGLTIAIANPLDEAARTVIEAAVAPVRVTWAVSPRDEILSAISRKMGRKTIGTYLLEAGIITAGALDDALALSQKVGIRVGRALVLLRHTSQQELVSFLARQQRLPFFDLDPDMIEPAVAKLLTERDARMNGALPIFVDEDSITVAMVDPLDSDAISNVTTALGREIVVAITTEDAFERALEMLYQDDYTYKSTRDLFFRYPEESAFRVITPSQKKAIMIIGGILLLGLLWNAVGLLVALNAVTTTFYLAFSFHRFYLVYRALSHDLEVPVSREEIDALEDRDLPIYTILVPLYKEAGVLPKLTRSINGLDYPLAKLDVKLLMESNDQETIRAAQALNLPPNFEHVIVPDSMPKTKPKACNYGLIKAKGEFVVIYDAEDIPDSDQLKKALVAFRKVGPLVACIQAKLNYFNRNQNLLTRWFTTEYSMWFDLFLPGLDASGAPVP